MAKINKNDLKKLGDADLNKKLAEVNLELMKLRSQKSSGAQLESPGMVTSLKRTKAVILTFLNQKKEDKKSK